MPIKNWNSFNPGHGCFYIMHFPVAHSGQNRRRTLLLRNFHPIFVNKKFSGEADRVDGFGVENVCMQMYEVEISVHLITVCFLNRKKKQQMIKRRTKRQQQKGRKEPKAKMKLNKRMLKKKTTLKTEIPKLMRYFSYSKHKNKHGCIDNTSAGNKDWASLSEGGVFYCHPVKRDQLPCLCRADSRDGAKE